MSKPARKQDDMRLWRVTIKATITKQVEEISTPAWCKGMDDAVANALDNFRMEHKRDEFKIESVTVDRNPQSKEDGARKVLSEIEGD